MVMGTASTMGSIAEALGIALPGAASAPAVHADRLRLAEASGRTAVAMALSGTPVPAALVTEASLHNAMVVLQATGGSTNGLIHLAAIAGRAGLALDYELFDRLGREVPVLVDLKPSGEHYMEHFHHAGGVPRLMRELKDDLRLDAPTVNGERIGDWIERAEDVPGQTVIRPRSRPVTPTGSMAVLKGNLAPRGAIIKQSAASERLMLHEGRAIVFEDADDLAARIDSDDLDVTADDVLVMRNAGPVGAPGMPESGYLPIPRKLARAGVKDMVRLSDARMSGTAFGTIVLHVTPEAAIGGPLALLRTGDRVRLDVPQRRIDMLVDEEELARRREAWRPRVAPPEQRRGYMRLFREQVLQADEGCDFALLRAEPDGPHDDEDHG
jgi:dihydroxy-acid dehydratase